MLELPRQGRQRHTTAKRQAHQGAAQLMPCQRPNAAGPELFGVQPWRKPQGLRQVRITDRHAARIEQEICVLQEVPECTTLDRLRIDLRRRVVLFGAQPRIGDAIEKQRAVAVTGRRGEHRIAVGSVGA